MSKWDVCVGRKECTSSVDFKSTARIAGCLHVAKTGEIVKV